MMVMITEFTQSSIRALFEAIMNKVNQSLWMGIVAIMAVVSILLMALGFIIGVYVVSFFGALTLILAGIIELSKTKGKS